jgi:serine/threonine protein kinase
MKHVKDVFKVEVFQLGVILFRLIYKTYPFEKSSHEDSQARNKNFIEEFERSNRNSYKVHVSVELKNLLKGMLAFDQEDRLTLDQVIESDWFYEQKKKLYCDKEVLMRTTKQIM